MKENIFSAILGAVGGFFAWFLGGWNNAIMILIIFMAVDFLSGLTVAFIFKKSPKTENGGASSKAGWIGLARKVFTLIIVGIAYWLDNIAGTTFIKDATVVAYIVIEAISIVENAGLMGVPIPNAISKGIEILKGKGDKNDEERY